MESSITSSPQRLQSIDVFRGLTIFLMILVIGVSGYRPLPQTMQWLGSFPVSTWRHAEVGWETYAAEKVAAGMTQEEVERLPEASRKNVGCTVTDLVAPFFVFIVGLCIPLSKAKHGDRWWHKVLTRTGMLIASGVIYISLILGLSWWWGILQAIGIAYLVGAISNRMSSTMRIAFLVVILAGHTIMSLSTDWWLGFGRTTDPFWTVGNPSGDLWRPLTVHCLPWVSISYGAMTIIGVMLGQSVASKDTGRILKASLILGLLFTVAGLLVHQIGIASETYLLCFDKPNVTASYAMFTSGVGCFVFGAIYWMVDVRGWSRGTVWLQVFGANALLAYFMQVIQRLAFTALQIQPFFKSSNETTQAWAAKWDFSIWQSLMTDRGGYWGLLWGLVWTMSIWSIVRAFNRRGLYWKL